jgi:altronate hydrolase
MQQQKILKAHPSDNVIVALTDLKAGEAIQYEGVTYSPINNIPAKHKFAAAAIPAGGSIIMYGVLVGKAGNDLAYGELLTTANTKHASSSFDQTGEKIGWQAPDVSAWQDRTFKGYHRSDGSVGTANYWLVIPLVFCENGNVETLKEALLEPLGYAQKKSYAGYTRHLISQYQERKATGKQALNDYRGEGIPDKVAPLFPQVTGVKFLTHEGGCGGTRQDAQTLCGLLAGYITHPNVAGATVLSLGCQNAQATILEAEIKKRSPNFDKPLHILDQQTMGTEALLLQEAIRLTFEGLAVANQLERQPAPLSKLCVGLECGGSDGFSGISANPALGHASDLLVAMGGAVILAEFPELCGVEQNLIDRCTTPAHATRFADLIKTYSLRAQQAGSGFDMNPSPGNIKDGLITDAMKSAGAARKGGSSPVTAVLDYPEKVTQPGLNLLCTPGNDVESTTAEVGAGANVVVFTTGLGTPTGNPIAPVVKVATNSILFKKMNDIIDLNTGDIIDGKESVAAAGERILDYIIKVASGEVEVAAVRNGQEDFIPWKRGISL